MEETKMEKQLNVDEQVEVEKVVDVELSQDVVEKAIEGAAKVTEMGLKALDEVEDYEKRNQLIYALAIKDVCDTDNKLVEAYLNRASDQKITIEKQEEYLKKAQEINDGKKKFVENNVIDYVERNNVRKDNSVVSFLKKAGEFALTFATEAPEVTAYVAVNIFKAFTKKAS